MSWYDKSRAVSNELITELPEEYFCLTDDDELLGASFDKDDIVEKTLEAGPKWEFASYARSGLASPGKPNSDVYHYAFPETIYVVFSIETGHIEANITSYDRANSVAVEAGEDYRFVPFIRYDRVTMRSWSDREKQEHGRAKELGFFNITGDKFDPIERMSPATFEEYKAETDRPESLLA